jgi:hypothetical protein
MTVPQSRTAGRKFVARNLGAVASLTSCPRQTNALTGAHATDAGGALAGSGTGTTPLTPVLAAVPDRARTCGKVAAAIAEVIFVFSPFHSCAKRNRRRRATGWRMIA